MRRPARMPVFPAAFAADGVEELLFGFGGRRGAGMRTQVERSLVLRATDLDAAWHVRLTPGDRGDVVTTREDGDAECAVAASASDLYLLLWNRREADGLRGRGRPECSASGGTRFGFAGADRRRGFRCPKAHRAPCHSPRIVAAPAAHTWDGGDER